jgi:hypothetical protein
MHDAWVDDDDDDDLVFVDGLQNSLGTESLMDHGWLDGWMNDAWVDDDDDDFVFVDGLRNSLGAESLMDHGWLDGWMNDAWSGWWW